jgi:endonuclease/exonuclease/phosphatase (EEP) superfamily protein YafD
MPRQLPLLLVLLLAVAGAHAQPTPIVLDEEFSDWDAVEPAFESEEGVFRRVWVASDDRYLFLSVEVATPIILQESRIILFLDGDADGTTGAPVHGLGVEVEWHFGLRTGTATVGGQSYTIDHVPLGLVSAPTVSSDRFEIALRRDAAVGSERLMGDEGVRFVLVDGISGERAPRAEATIAHTFEGGARARDPVVLARPEAPHLRVVSYNVRRDGPFFARDAVFGRVLRAIDPDLIAFQEMYVTTPEFVADWLGRDLPDGAPWHVRKAANDIILASRFPITDAEAVRHHDAFAPRTGAFVVDLRPAFDTDLLVYGTHPSCCANDVPRQEQLDALMGDLRDRRVTLPHGTPFLLAGDFNLVTHEAQRRTVQFGEISDTARFGPAFAPDWDGTPLGDLRPLVTGLPMTFTWYDEGSDFSPGRLDYIFYSDASLEALGGLTLFSLGLTEAELEAYGLEAYDTTMASDHLPVVGDFRLRAGGTSSGPAPAPSVTLHLGVYPNPASDRVTLTLRASGPEVLVTLYDVLGREVQALAVPVADGGRGTGRAQDGPPRAGPLRGPGEGGGPHYHPEAPRSPLRPARLPLPPPYVPPAEPVHPPDVPIATARDCVGILAGPLRQLDSEPPSAAAVASSPPVPARPRDDHRGRPRPHARALGRARLRVAPAGRVASGGRRGRPPRLCRIRRLGA